MIFPIKLFPLSVKITKGALITQILFWVMAWAMVVAVLSGMSTANQYLVKLSIVVKILLFPFFDNGNGSTMFKLILFQASMPVSVTHIDALRLIREFFFNWQS